MSFKAPQTGATTGQLRGEVKEDGGHSQLRIAPTPQATINSRPALGFSSSID
jgi:hypothetical protein